MAQDPNRPSQASDERPPHFLTQWREFRGWSQQELGDMVDASHSKISRIERGETALKAGFLRKLSKVFQVPASALLEIDPSRGEGRQTAEMLTVWARIPSAKRADALAVLRALQNNGDPAKTG